MCFTFGVSCGIAYTCIYIFVEHRFVIGNTSLQYHGQLNYSQISDDGNSKVGNCWKCNGVLGTSTTDILHPADYFYCPHSNCLALQPPSTQNHFERLGLPTDYEIDTDKLAKDYRKIQQRLHPDKTIDFSQVGLVLTID